MAKTRRRGRLREPAEWGGVALGAVAVPLRPHARRRWLVRSLACVALGTVTTIAVAWGFAAVPIPADAAYRRSHGSRLLAPAEGHGHFGVRGWTWHGVVNYSAGAVCFSSDANVGVVPATGPERVCPWWMRSYLLAWCDGRAPWPTAQRTESRTVCGCGWPLPALSCSIMVEHATQSPAAPAAGGFGFTVREMSGRKAPDFASGRFPNTTLWGIALLPTVPVWHGLLADTALYAALWSLLLIAPAAVRPVLRRRRGHCPACGYDVRGDYVKPCPECGRGSAEPTREQDERENRHS